MTQTEKHEKAILVLENIEQAQMMIESHESSSYQFLEFLGSNDNWHKKRILANKAIKDKLENYYNNNFKI